MVNRESSSVAGYPPSGGIQATEETPLFDNGEEIIAETGTSELVTGTTTILPSSKLVQEEPYLQKNPHQHATYGTQDTENGLIGEEDVVETPRNSAAVFPVMSVLAIGVLIGSADSSFVMATHPTIASEFNALGSSSWLFTGFTLAAAATGNTISKLGEIFGRRGVIAMTYVVFGIGCLMVGVANSMSQVIAGRVVSGSAGAGMGVLISVSITDLVPIRDVPTWRAYIMLVGTLGRSLGAPLGGYLADTIGWRLSFSIQGPLLFITALLVWVVLPRKPSTSVDGEEPKLSALEQVAQIDFLGAVTLGLLITSTLIPLELGGVVLPWSHPLITLFFVCAIALLGAFIVIEKHWAKDPILPLEIFANTPVVLCYGITLLQVAAMVGLMFSVPLYFQVTNGVTNTEAGGHLLPMIIGNTAAGIASAAVIKRTGKYKSLLLGGTAISAVGYALIVLRWNGNTNWLESLYVIPVGVGMGLVFNTLFVSIQASASKDELAPALAALHLSMNLGASIGLAVLNLVLQAVLKQQLESRLLALGLDKIHREKIMEKALSNVEYISHAPARISEALVTSYEIALRWTNGVSLIFLAVTLLFGVFVKQRKLQ